MTDNPPSSRGTQADMQAGAKSNAIAKVCLLLKALADQSPQRLNELSAATGLNRVTTFRILEELTAEGLIAKSGSPPRYDFGPEFVAMTAATTRSLDFVEHARPSLLRLAELSGDTVLLHLRSNAESLCVDKAVGSFPIRANLLNIGSRRPLGIGGGSMALLAWVADVERTTILDITCANLKNYPNFNRKKFEDFIEESRRQGHVTMCDIIIDKMGAIAAPILSPNKSVHASLSIAALSDRILQRERFLAEALKQEARIIERSLRK